MDCRHCGQEISDDAAFCQFCGSAQQNTAPGAGPTRLLRRSLVDRQIAGVCGGIARYLDTDPVFVRVAWVILTIIPGAIFLGVLAYLVAWLVIPDAALGTEVTTESATAATSSTWRTKRLQRSVTDAKIGGVCGGIADYFGVDSTAIRLLWVVLTIFPGAIICGLLTYVVAWFIMPQAAAVAPPPAPVEPAAATSTE